MGYMRWRCQVTARTAARPKWLRRGARIDFRPVIGLTVTEVRPDGWFTGFDGLYIYELQIGDKRYERSPAKPRKRGAR
jgi:hypothetical protein